MKIPCSVTEEDKQVLLSQLLSDLRAVLEARWRLHYNIDEGEDYRDVVDDKIKELIFFIAQEYVEHYDLAPIDH